MQQYDVLYGRWPESYDEVVLIVSENNEISDLVLYAWASSPPAPSPRTWRPSCARRLDTELESWSYEDMCNKTFRYIYPGGQVPVRRGEGGIRRSREEELGLRTLYNNGLEVSIVGVIRQNDDAVSANMTGAVGYTHALVEQVVAPGGAEGAGPQSSSRTPSTTSSTACPSSTRTTTP